MEDNKKQAPRWVGGVEPAKELLSATGTQILEIECRQQPECLRQLLTAYAGDSGIQAELKQFHRLAQRPGPVLFIGMGASYCSSISGSTLLESHGRLSFSVDAGEWLNYAASVWEDAALSILVTTSGESAELVELFKRAGKRTPGLICNNAASTCWHLAQHKLPILAGPEYGNATKTYTNAASALLTELRKRSGASSLLGPFHPLGN